MSTCRRCSHKLHVAKLPIRSMSLFGLFQNQPFQWYDGKPESVDSGNVLKNNAFGRFDYLTE